MPTVTEPRRIGEIVAYEADQNYCRENITFINNSGATATHTIGQVLEVFSANHGPIATEANAVGVLLTDVGELANNGTANAVMLRRGPALIIADKLGVSGQTLADILTAFAALSPPILSKPVVDSTDKTVLGA